VSSSRRSFLTSLTASVNSRSATTSRRVREGPGGGRTRAREGAPEQELQHEHDSELKRESDELEGMDQQNECAHEVFSSAKQVRTPRRGWLVQSMRAGDLTPDVVGMSSWEMVVKF